MSEIQAIANNNYILHNIDAKKLYVQEPLFTANSGDAVYVGWRPDETVLFSSDNGTSAGQLAESRKNFSRLKLELGVPNQTSGQDGISYFDISNRYDYSWAQYGMGAGGANAYWVNAKINWVDDTHFEINYASTIMKNQTSTAVSGPTASNTAIRNCIYQIIGINRVSGGNA